MPDRIAPDSSPHIYSAAIASLYAGRFDEAIAFAERLEDQATMAELICVSKFLSGNAEGALATVRAAYQDSSEEADPETVAGLVLLEATALRVLSRFDEALELLAVQGAKFSGKAASELQQKTYWKLRSEAETRVGNLEEARSCAEKALQLAIRCRVYSGMPYHLDLASTVWITTSPPN